MNENKSAQWYLNTINLQILALNYMMAGNAILNNEIDKANIITYMLSLTKIMRNTLKIIG